MQKGGGLTVENKEGWRRSVSGLWNVKHSGCASQDAEPPKVQSILRKDTKSSRPKRCFHYMQYALHFKKIREETGPSLGVMQPSCRHAQLFALQNSRNEPKRIPSQKSDGLAEKPGIGKRCKFTRSLDLIRATFFQGMCNNRGLNQLQTFEVGSAAQKRVPRERPRQGFVCSRTPAHSPAQRGEQYFTYRLPVRNFNLR